MQGTVDRTTDRSRDNHISCTLLHQLNLDDLTKILGAKDLLSSSFSEVHDVVGMFHLLSKTHNKGPSRKVEPNKDGKKVCMTSLKKGLETMPNSQGIDRVFLGPRHGPDDRVTKQSKIKLLPHDFPSQV